MPVDPNDPHAIPAEVKICKFLSPYDCMVSADLDGFINFWAVTPHPRKNELLCSVKDDNISEVGTKVNFPIRAIDFDAEDKLLFTGDEMGYMHKWDLSVLLEKLEEVTRREQKVAYKSDILLEDPSVIAAGHHAKKSFGEAINTFVTGVDAGAPKQKIVFENSDV